MAFVARASSASSYATAAHASLYLFITPPPPVGRHHRRPSSQRRRDLFDCVIERRPQEVRPNGSPPAAGLLLHSIAADASDTAAAPAAQPSSPKDNSWFSGLFRHQEEGWFASGGGQEEAVGGGSWVVDHRHCSTINPSIPTVPREEIALSELFLELREEVTLPIDLKDGRAGGRREGGGGGGGGTEEVEWASTRQVNGARPQKPRQQQQEEETGSSSVRVSTSSRQRATTTTTKTQQNPSLDGDRVVSQSQSQHRRHHHRQQQQQQQPLLLSGKQQHGRRSLLSSPLPSLGAQPAGREYSGKATEQRGTTPGQNEHDHLYMMDATSTLATTDARGAEETDDGDFDGEGKVEAGAGASDFADVEVGPVAESYERGRWLLGLLVLQSTSSFVLDKYQVSYNRVWRLLIYSYDAALQ